MYLGCQTRTNGYGGFFQSHMIDLCYIQSSFDREDLPNFLIEIIYRVSGLPFGGIALI